MKIIESMYWREKSIRILTSFQGYRQLGPRFRIIMLMVEKIIIIIIANVYCSFACQILC